MLNEDRKLAIMQPYFFPYIAYYALLNLVDEFILFDTPQFIRHGWIERNRILNFHKLEPMYFKVPLLKKSNRLKINEITIDKQKNWKQKILSQLIPYKKKATFYPNVILLLEEIFSQEFESIAELNYHSLVITAKYLGINTEIKLLSKMNLSINPAKEADEWALEITKALAYKNYYNAENGHLFFDKSKYENEGIQLFFLKMQATRYNQKIDEFIPFLSLIDVMMFNSVDEIQDMLKNYILDE